MTTHDQLAAIPHRVDALEAVVAGHVQTLGVLLATNEHLADRIPRLEAAIRDLDNRLTRHERRTLNGATAPGPAPTGSCTASNTPKHTEIPPQPSSEPQTAVDRFRKAQQKAPI